MRTTTRKLRLVRAKVGAPPEPVFDRDKAVFIFCVIFAVIALIVGL